MQRHLATACVLSIALIAGVYAPASIADDAPPPAPVETTEPDTDVGNLLLAQIVKYRRETWRWERLMRVPHTRATQAAERSNDREQRELILNAWRAKAEKRRRQAAHPPRRAQWLCIHRYERHPRQGWATATGNGYYGGLQFDRQTWVAYDGDQYAPLPHQAGRDEQIAVASRVRDERGGYGSWPACARKLGLPT